MFLDRINKINRIEKEKIMKKIMMQIVFAAVCLLQQGCYMFVDREGKYFASTKEAWSSRHGEWWPHLRTTGDGMMFMGALIPVVGWVTLLPAGFVVNAAECCAVAPAYDTILLPIDCLDNWLLQIDEENYQDTRRLLEFNLDATLADSAYWEDEDKIRYLSRWLSEKSDLKNLSGRQVSAILSILRSWLKGKVDIDWRRKDVCQCIVKAVYDKSCDRESLDMLTKGLVEIKEATNVYMFQVIPYEIELAILNASGDDKDNVKFNDEQLMVLRDADIMSQKITRVLKARQEKREKEANGQRD